MPPIYLKEQVFAEKYSLVDIPLYIIQVVYALCLVYLSLTGHGNHKEDSPFLNSADAASKKNDFYDRNLALFEVCYFSPYLCKMFHLHQTH